MDKLYFPQHKMLMRVRLNLLRDLADIKGLSTVGTKFMLCERLAKAIVDKEIENDRKIMRI